MVSQGADESPEPSSVQRGSTAEVPSAQQGAVRRHADVVIAQRLAQLDYDLQHPICKQFADWLLERGIGTLVNLHATDELFGKCTELGIRGLPPPPASWSYEAHQIIVDAVRSAVPEFITKSMPTWNPARSSIGTYFVNYCLFHFKKVYSAFWRASRDVPNSGVMDHFSLRRADEEPELQALNRQTVREIAKLMDSPELARIVILSATGRTHKQIACELGVSESTVWRRLRSFREKLEVNGWPTIDERR